MSRSDPDLSGAITLRPSPFHQHPERTDRKDTFPLTAPGQSSSYAVDSNELPHDPVARPVYTRNSSDSEREDVERQGLPSYSDANDPYSLRHGLKTTDEIDTIKANTSRKRMACGTLTQPKEKIRVHRIKGFYEAQNERIEKMLTPVDDLVRLAREEQGADALQYKIAVRGSFAANLLLAVLQIYAATSSKSLSLITTMADAIFDPMSNAILLIAARAIKRVDPRRFPSGKARIETAGNITFCFVMAAVSLVIIVESIRDIAEGNGGDTTTKFHLSSVIAVGIAFTTKFCLFLYCWSLRNKYSQIRILWLDHRNDLFINGIGLMTSVLGSFVFWMIDPIGAIILSVLIITIWLRTAYTEFQLLIGVSADTGFLQHITYISMTHSPQIKSLDTVRAWHSGPRIIVEVDVVMEQNMSLKETHDVAEELQTKLESLPDVERAYVHVDYETSHAPEHFWKKEL